MKLPSPAQQYDATGEANFRKILEQTDAQNYKRNQDVEIGSKKITPPNRLILCSPNGSKYEILVSNSGVLSASAL